MKKRFSDQQIISILREAEAHASHSPSMVHPVYVAYFAVEGLPAAPRGLS
ncbi:hypothetical protein [Klebsiella michiganensis]|nr:hypothetical protein [Klebsiella michiganensis]